MVSSLFYGASEHDGHHFDDVLDQSNTGKQVDTDKGYASAQRSATLKALGFKDGIQRKAQKNKPLSACQQRRNRAIAKDPLHESTSDVLARA